MFAAGIIAVCSPAFSQVDDSSRMFESVVSELPTVSSSHKISHHRPAVAGPIFGLTAATDLPFRDQVVTFLSAYDLPDMVEVKLKHSEKKSSGREFLTYMFYVDDMAVDHFTLKANRQKDGTLFFTGEVPNLIGDQSFYALSKVPSSEKIDSETRNFLELIDPTLNLNGLEISHSKDCVTVHDGRLLKAKCYQARADARAYDFTISEEGITQFHAASFHAIATLKNIIFENINSETRDHVVKVNEPVRFLENERFVILPGDGSKVEAVDGEFSYTGFDSTEARQIHAFSFANRMFDWYDSLGFTGAGRQITIRTGQAVKTPDGTETQDNAAFYPSEWMIAIGKGSGEALQNLGVDIDVVAHEVGHFIVYQGINKINPKVDETAGDHSAAIHEGLADYFTYASTGDACLGDTVCPSNSPFCWHVKLGQNRCLRIGLNIGFVYGDNTYNSLPSAHLKGQLVAATLMRARIKQAGGDYFDFDQVVLNAIDYMPSSVVSYGEMLLAVMASDKELAKGKFCADVYDSAVEHGLTQWMESVGADCASFTAPTKSGNIVSLETANEDDYVATSTISIYRNNVLLGNVGTSTSTDDTSSGEGTASAVEQSSGEGETRTTITKSRGVQDEGSGCGVLASATHKSHSNFSSYGLGWLILLLAPLAVRLRENAFNP